MFVARENRMYVYMWSCECVRVFVGLWYVCGAVLLGRAVLLPRELSGLAFKNDDAVCEREREREREREETKVDPSTTISRQRCKPLQPIGSVLQRPNTGILGDAGVPVDVGYRR